MTQLSRERLEEIAELARKATYKPCAMHMTNMIAVCDSEVIEEMARRLLALEGRPSPSQAHLRQLVDVVWNAATESDEVPSTEWADQLIAAVNWQETQPAPVAQPVQVPPEKWVNPDIHYADENGFAEGWNACRAAMLKAEPVSQPYKLPDGWKLVPVEPTAEMREAYHQAQAEYEDEDGLWSPDHQWQAMLAAAPQEPTK